MRAVPAVLTLTDELDTIVIRPAVATAADPIVCRTWDLGAPEVRVTTTARAGADGVDMGAGYLGARTVTLDLQILGNDPYSYQERLAAMTHPTRRPTLKITRAAGSAAGQTWTMALRGNPFSVSYGRRAAALLEMQLSFTAPDGVLEGPLKSRTTSPAGGSGGGFTFPATLPDDFGHSSVVNPVLNIDIGGSTAVSPIVYISGPVTNPQVRTDDGERFVFTGLTLTAGQTVQIDMGAGTVLLGTTESSTVDADATLYHLVDFNLSTFWRWLPGPHVMRYVATTGTATVQWRERRLTI